jgi:hypothetical protein
MCRRKYSKKEKTPQFSTAVSLPLRELPEPDNLARFHHTPSNVNHPLVSPPDHFPAMSNR